MRAFWSPASTSPAMRCSRTRHARVRPRRRRGPSRAMSASCSALFAVLLALAPALSAPARAQASRAPLELATFPRTSLEITHRDAHHALRKFPFEVWVADTPERAQQGLMFVSDLPEGRGMVFPLSTPRVETMWMKNTYI